MLSGEREYVIAETALQSACRQALQHPSPSLSLIRRWASATLMLGRGAAGIAGAAGATEAAVASAVNSARASGAQSASQRVDGIAASAASAHASSTGARPHPELPHVNGTRSHDMPAQGCRYCGGRLPDGRVLTFCPHCGLDLTKRQCPACSTEMEMSWRFCVTCGRGAEGIPVELATSDKRQPVARAAAG